MAHLPLSFEPEVIQILALENERLKKELDEWKAAAGWRADGFGPQTPAEVAVFQRESDRVNGQVTGFKLAVLQADLSIAEEGHAADRLRILELEAALEEARAAVRLMLKENGEERTALAKVRTAATEVLQNLEQQLEAYWRRSDRNRRFAFLWKEHAKTLAINCRALETVAHAAADVLEGQTDASKQLLEKYRLEQQTHAVYRETAEHFMRAMQFHHDLAAPVLKACKAIPEHARKGLVLGMPWLGTLYAAINTWIEKDAAADQFGSSEPGVETPTGQG